ncbi:serine hydrolase domain-containing protein [Vannielia sp. SX4]|uniref:serine hydrolase domain-containing protein n=1 Tax=Vannielia sp. SX4 TaxID=3463852 RepID=UPI004058B2D6
MARALAALLLLLALTGPLAAQGKAGAVEQVWRQWAAANGLPATTLAVAENGQIVARRGIGANPDTAFDLASLSKGITGACIAALVREDRLRLDTPLGLILGAQSARHVDTPLSAFLTHSAGLWPDATQRMSLRQWARSSALHLPVVRPALARAPRGKGRTRYNNENYAVLGAVIEAVTGQGYYTACARRLGLSGLAPSPRWGGTGAFGGWRGSAAAYTAFQIRHFGPRSSIGAAPRRWALNRIDGNSSYSMGMLTRSSRLGQVFWHAGLLCSSRKRGSGGYTVTFGGRLTVTVLFTGCVSENDLRDLGKRLTQVAVR